MRLGLRLIGSQSAVVDGGGVVGVATDEALCSAIGARGVAVFFRS